MKKEHSKRRSHFITKLHIDNFPSRYEIYKLLEVLLSEKHYPIQYESINKDNAITLVFSNSTIALDFAKVLQTKKIDSSFYHGIQTKITLELNREGEIKPTYRVIETVPNAIGKQLDDDENAGLLPEKRMVRGLNTESRQTKMGRDHLETREVLSSRVSKGNTLIYSQSFNGRSNGKQSEKKKKTKGKRLYLKGFDLNVTQVKSQLRNQIPNYVNMSPSNPVYMHQYREVHSDKWVGKDNFHLS